MKELTLFVSEYTEIYLYHVRMLVSIPLKISVSRFLEYLKGKSSVLIYQKHANLKLKYRKREFWCREYYVDTKTNDRKINTILTTAEICDNLY